MPTADTLAALLANLLALRGLSFADLGGAIVSSTVPQLADLWRWATVCYLGHESLVVGPTLKSGMPTSFGFSVRIVMRSRCGS